MSQAIIYNDADVLANWAELLRAAGETDGNMLDFSDHITDKYGFSKESLIWAMCPLLVYSFQANWKISDLNFVFPVQYCVVLGNKFFQTMNEQDQQSFFLAIFFALLLHSI